jgi:hypothetical protein
LELVMGGFFFALALLGSIFSALNFTGIASTRLNPDWTYSEFRHGDRRPLILVRLHSGRIHVAERTMMLPHVSVRMERTRVPLPVFGTRHASLETRPGQRG